MVMRRMLARSAGLLGGNLSALALLGLNRDAVRARQYGPAT